jgi:hypothetical protein
LANERAQTAPADHDEVDLDELMDVSRSLNVYLLVYFLFPVCIGSIVFLLHYHLIVKHVSQDPELEKLHAERIAALKVLSSIFHF